MNKEEIIESLRLNKQLLRRYLIKDIFLFGSVARGEANEASDVDILVEFDPEARIGLFQFIRLRRELSDLLGREVDLATPDSLHKALKADILKEAIHAS